ncbi:hypothetical protein ACROYT_G025688 [Oculina patagonica]
MLQQSIPDTTENSQQASGPAKGKISRNSPEFDKLEPCYNNAIIFRDEEGTGADRLMSKGCKDKLTKLATLVKQQWPSVKLVVTEAWDEQDQHSENSLHYEGRAVDLRLSDRDRAKIGLLGRLAVEAGFDWVFYESRSHIHASVREDGFSKEPWDGCFSSDSTVKLENGVDLQVRNLRVGDLVQVMTQEGTIGLSEVAMFADYKPDIPHASHVLIETEKPAKQITLTPSHLIFTSNSTGMQLQSKHAGKVLPGEFLLVSLDGALVPSQVKRVSLVKRTGMVAPVTMEGNIIVDGVLSSCYAMITDHKIAHMVFGPLRLVHNYGSNLWNTDRLSVQQGKHWYPELLMTINKALGLFELS